MLQLAEIDEAANEEIETPIIVIIKPHGAGGPAGSCNASFFSDIRECAVTVVVIEDAAAVLSHIEIGETVPVIIADGCPHAIAAAHDAGLFGNICKRTVAIVVVKGVAQRPGGRPEIARTTIHQIDVHPAIVVVVKKCAACASGFREILLRRLAAGMDKIDLGSGGKQFDERWREIGLIGRIGKTGRNGNDTRGSQGSEKLAAVKWIKAHWVSPDRQIRVLQPGSNDR